MSPISGYRIAAYKHHRIFIPMTSDGIIRFIDDMFNLEMKHVCIFYTK